MAVKQSVRAHPHTTSLEGFSRQMDSGATYTVAGWCSGTSSTSHSHHSIGGSTVPRRNDKAQSQHATLQQLICKLTVPRYKDLLEVIYFDGN
jgi:hypothetical protein